MASLPDIYLSSKRSAYRREVASTAIPPTERERRRAEFARTAYDECMKLDEMGRRLLVDLPDFFGQMMRIGKEISSRIGGEDPFYRDLFTGGIPDGVAGIRGTWLRAFERNGFVILPNKGLNHGPILATEEALGQRIYLSALMGNESLRGSARIEQMGITVIDASSIVEDAVFKINAFRFGELEPIASALLKEGEAGGARGIFDARLRMAFDRSGVRDQDGIGRLIDELAYDRTEQSVGYAGAKACMAVWSASSVMEYEERDPMAHTASIVNRLAANAIISYGMCGRLASEFGPKAAETPEARALGTLAGIAFGEPYDKLAAIVGGNLSGRADPLLNYYLARLNMAMGYRKGQGQRKANQLVLSRSGGAIRMAAIGLLNEELAARGGRPLKDDEAAAFESAGRMKPLSGRDFQRAVGVWAERKAD